MAKALVDNLEGLPKDVAAEYELVNDTKSPYHGKYKLKVEPVADLVLENVTSLKSTVQALRGEKATLESKIKSFEGIEDPEVAKDAMKKVAEWGNMTPAQKAQELLAEKEKQLQAKFKATEEALTKSRDTALSQLDKTIRVAALTTELAKRKVETPDLLLPHVLAATRMRQSETGEFIVDVVDEKGNARISPVGSGTDPMTIPHLVDEMKVKYPSAFPADGASGSGATGGGSGSGAPKNNGTVKTVSRTDQDGMNRNLEGIAKGTVKVV